MQMSSECIGCVLGSTFDLMIKQLPPEKHEMLVRDMLEIAKQQNWQESPPEFARKLYDFLREAGGDADSFAAAKQQSTRLALQLLPEMRQLAHASSDPFGSIVKAVIGGNIIDCGVDRSLNIAQAIEELKEVFAMPLDESAIREFEKHFYRAESIFYMLDNCGEAVLDRLLLEKFSGKITLGVRGGCVLNDITRAELQESGLADYPVFDTGDTTPGVSLKRSNKEFINAMRSADLVIAKGQGNYETLDIYDRPIVHLLRLKCPVVSRTARQERGSLALIMRNMPALD